MSQPVKVAVVALSCGLIGWIVGQMTTSASAQTGASPVSKAIYEMNSIYLPGGGDNYQAWKIDQVSGATWQEGADNKLVKIKDQPAIPSGDYALHLIANEKFYLVHRIDRVSGRIWRINGTEWVELTQQK